jgi:hypothetical protein
VATNNVTSLLREGCWQAFFTGGKGKRSVIKLPTVGSGDKNAVINLLIFDLEGACFSVIYLAWKGEGDEREPFIQADNL